MTKEERSASASRAAKARIAGLRATGQLVEANRHAALVRWGYYRRDRKGRLIPTAKGKLLEALKAAQASAA